MAGWLCQRRVLLLEQTKINTFEGIFCSHFSLSPSPSPLSHFSQLTPKSSWRFQAKSKVPIRKREAEKYPPQRPKKKMRKSKSIVLTFVYFAICYVVKRLSHYGLPLLTFYSVHRANEKRTSTASPCTIIMFENKMHNVYVYCSVQTLRMCVPISTFSIFVCLLMRLSNACVVCVKEKRKALDYI